MALSVVRADAGTGLSTWSREPGLAGIDAHPFTGGFGRGYYPLVFGGRRRDASFAVLEGSEPVLVTCCTLGEGRLDWYGLPAVAHASGTAADGTRDAALAVALDCIGEMVAGGDIDTAELAEPLVDGALSSLGEACFSRGWHGTAFMNGLVELAAGETGLRKGLRKSYRSLVNWGRRNLVLHYVNRGRPDHADFAAYRDFHRRIAGRDTRSEASWRAMFDWIARGGGELTLGRLASGELVAGSMVVDGADVAYYASGVYDRARFDQPMAHFPLYDAILRAGARGRRCFDLGVLPQAATVDAKEHQIGYFKRGFAGRIGVSMRWTLARGLARSPAAPEVAR